jgi:hypothetical protein
MRMLIPTSYCVDPQHTAFLPISFSDQGGKQKNVALKNLHEMWCSGSIATSG